MSQPVFDGQRRSIARQPLEHHRRTPEGWRSMGKRISYLDTDRVWIDAIETYDESRREAVDSNWQNETAHTRSIHTHGPFKEGLHAIHVTNVCAGLGASFRAVRGMSFGISPPYDTNVDAARMDAENGRIQRSVSPRSPASTFRRVDLRTARVGASSRPAVPDRPSPDMRRVMPVSILDSYMEAAPF